MTPKFAFRCKNCGHFAAASHAGERAVPFKCQVCSAGIVPAMSLAQLQKDRPELFKGTAPADLAQVRDGGRVLPLTFGMVAWADHPNWQVLADMAPAELQKLGLAPDQVERHIPHGAPNPAPSPAPGPNKAVAATATDGTGVRDGAKA
jgi:hypothetical protein